MTDEIMPRGALTYNGAAIRDRNQMLSLTDMWRAAGSPQSREPFQWIRSAEAGRFVEFILSNLRISQDEGIQQVRGGTDPGTWAHWQIAMAYAKYLSPEFHAWCNEVVRAHMEGQIAPNFAGLAIDQIVTAVALRLDARISSIVEAKLLADNRVAARTHMSVRDLLDERKIPTHHRNSINRKIGNLMRDYTSQSSDIEALRCRQSNTWLFPAAWARRFIQEHCLEMIADHMDWLNTEQGTLPFPKGGWKRSRIPMKGDQLGTSAPVGS